jgi:hypothetical protein
MRFIEEQVVSDLLVVGLFFLRLLFQSLWRGSPKGSTHRTQKNWRTYGRKVKKQQP